MPERCPTCNARCAGKPQCHRCGMELAPLQALLNASRDHLTQARQNFHDGHFEAMLINARRAVALWQTPAGQKLLALAALATRRFDLALRLWYQIRGKEAQHDSRI